MSAKVLVVDDEPNVLRLMGYALEIEGYEVITAETGTEALERIETEQPDLVVLDVMLPDISGIDVCRQLRGRPETRNLPIIMLSARTRVADKIKGLRSGADEYVTKPVEWDEMVARVDALLERHARMALEVPPSEMATTGQILAVYGPKGGVGRTFIAVNLAVALSQVSQKRVVLIDGNPQFGDVGLTLTVHSHLCILDLLRAGDPDEGLVDTVLASHPSGIRVLLAPLSIESNEVVEAAPLQKILFKLQKMFDFVIVDAWPSLDECTQAILDIADKIVLVTTPEMSAIRKARLFLEQARSSGHMPGTPLLVLNRYDGKGGIPTRDIERILQHRAVAKIPDDAGLVVYSLNQGVPLVISHPRSTVARSLLKLAERIVKGRD